MAEDEVGKSLSILDNIKVFSDVTKTLFFIVSCVLIGLFIIWRQGGDKDITVPIFWSLACLASGGIVGFLFGIPRVLQDNPTVALGNNENSAINNDGNKGGNNEKNKTLPLSYRIMVNTNLEQISDWLTKIIVGIGLIELRNVPRYLNSLSLFFSAGLDGETIQSQSLAAAIIVYFVIVGFLGVYLMTRIYLAQVFSKADRETQQTATFGGERLTLQEVSEQLFKKVNDVEKEVLIAQQPLENLSPDKTAEERTAGEKPKVKSILWVDDHPKNNSLDIQRLNERGITVDLSFTTDDALQKIKSKTYDKIISDMVRRMGSKSEEKAGINLIKTVRNEGKDTPIFIYCTESSVIKYKQEALAAGAEIITSSSTELMKALQLD